MIELKLLTISVKVYKIQLDSIIFVITSHDSSIHVGSVRLCICDT